DSAPAPGWETWIDMLEHDESWKKLMDRRSRLRGYFLALYNRVVVIFKDHVRGMGKEHTIRSLNDAKRYFFCFVDPESYTGKRFYVRMQDEIKYWRQDYIHEEYNPYTGKRSYWGGTPIPADAPPRPHDRAKWDDETASWQ
ncbi:MAG: hypothetical protein Q4D36_06280, partial [Bacteroidales bacterium]|nr:hypothetical protein [Bacteroidales bacterium]